MKLISRTMYDLLADAPDDWETFSFAVRLRSRRSLHARGLIEMNGRQWKITVDGLEMVRRCIKEWQLQAELPLEETK